jgi:hypothetical protein
MSVDLWALYKTVYARTRRPKSALTNELAFRAAEAAKAIVESENISSVEDLKTWESLWLRQPDVQATKFCAEVFEYALLTGDYVINRPHQNIGALGGYDPSIGSVYIATSVDRPGNIKVGATSIAPGKRVNQLRIRHGIDFALSDAIYTAYPGRVETLFQKACQKHRTNTNIYAESNEWYEMEPMSAFRYLEALQGLLASYDFELKNPELQKVVNVLAG